MGMEKRLHMKIYGAVQGVGFRYSAVRKARELGLVGWVRNCDDGCVEMEVEGETSALEEYRKWCRKGPSWAKVRKVQEEWKAAEGNYSTFEIQ